MTDSIFFSMSLSMSHSEMSGFTPYNTQESKKSTNNDEGTLHCCHVLVIVQHGQKVYCIWCDIDLAFISPLPDRYGVVSYLFMHGKLFII